MDRCPSPGYRVTEDFPEDSVKQKDSSRTRVGVGNALSETYRLRVAENLIPESPVLPDLRGDLQAPRKRGRCSHSA